jgi:glc operon protein GlcG
MRQIVSLGHAEALLAIEVVKDELVRSQKLAVVAVADAQGELIALLRLDGAPLPSTTIAANKAFTAARERKATLEIGQSSRHAEHGFDIAYFGDPRFIGWGGGVPVLVDGQVVGAVAVSGLTQEEDAELASLGIAAITKSLG